MDVVTHAMMGAVAVAAGAAAGAAVFVVNVAGWWAWGTMTIGRVLAVQIPVTAIGLWLQIRSPHYRGVGARYQRR